MQHASRDLRRQTVRGRAAAGRRDSRTPAGSSGRLASMRTARTDSTSNRFVQLRTREQLFVSTGFHAARSVKPRCRTASRRNADFRAFTSTIVRPNLGTERKRQRNGRGAAAGADVHELWTTGRGEMTRGDDRLQQQPVDRLVRILERGQIDLPVPTGEKLVVGDQLGRVLVEKHRLGCPRASRVRKSRATHGSLYLNERC